jgi:hypothetical protein
VTLLSAAFKARIPVLIKGAPGIGKSELVAQSCQSAGADLILSHPAVADPTDAKGLPWVVDKIATFLPFGDLRRAMQAMKLTVWFLDDLGQASPAVQASFMQLLLAREVNGQRISDHVVFVAATNRRTDKAAVTGVLEPVKSRFGTIVELEPDVDEWCQWALTQEHIDAEDIAFIRFQPDLLCKFAASADLTNSPVPRTWSHACRLLKLGLSENVLFSAVSGAVGEGAATERLAFKRLCREMPNVDQILLDPNSVDVPTSPAILYALAGALAHRATDENFGRVGQFIQRMVDAGKAEFGVVTLKDAIRRTPTLTRTQAFQTLAVGELGGLISGQ